MRYADIGQGGLGGFNGEAPLVVEFQEGDRVPVVFDFSGEDFRLEPQRPPLELIAKRHIFVRFAMDGVRTSLDGVEFDRKPRVPGSFRFGLRAVKGEPTRFEIAIVAPKR